MGEFADDVQLQLRDELKNSYSTFRWETEYSIAGTPVDIAGVGENHLILIELEWRRADPADNTAKLFRYLKENEITAPRVTVFQLFTEYYDLVRGGVQSKRKNAEFIGETAAEAFEQLTYHPLDFDIDPPKRGENRPPDWEQAAEMMAREIAEAIQRG